MLVSSVKVFPAVLIERFFILNIWSMIKNDLS